MAGTSITDLRLQVKSDVLTCRKCPRYTNLGGPIPFDGDSGNVAAIQSSPSMKAVQYGKQLDEDAEEVLREATASWTDEPWVFSLVSCIGIYRGRVEAADPPAIAKCKGNFQAQMKLVDPKGILMLDDRVLSYFRPDYFWSPMKGRPFLLQGGERLAMCVDHPGDHQAVTGSFSEDLEYFYHLVGLDKSKWLENFPTYCSCGKPGKAKLPDGLTLCRACRG